MAACENSTSVLCCCHIVPFVVEERNFLSRRITRLTLCWWGYTGGSRYVAQNKCVFLPGKMFVSWQKVLTGDPLLTLKKPKCLPSVRLKLKADLDMVFWGIVRPVITGTWSDKQRAVEVTEAWNNQTVQTPVLLAWLWSEPHWRQSDTVTY